MFSLGGPYPAEVLALTEMLYGMYVPAQKSNVMLQTIGGQHVYYCTFHYNCTIMFHH